MIQLASGLGKRTVAEFVSDQESLDLIAEFGVDYAQGFFIGKPVPVEDVTALKTVARD